MHAREACILTSPRLSREGPMASCFSVCVGSSLQQPPVLKGAPPSL